MQSYQRCSSYPKTTRENRETKPRVKEIIGKKKKNNPLGQSLANVEAFAVMMHNRKPRVLPGGQEDETVSPPVFVLFVPITTFLREMRLFRNANAENLCSVISGSRSKTSEIVRKSREINQGKEKKANEEKKRDWCSFYPIGTLSAICNKCTAILPTPGRARLNMMGTAAGQLCFSRLHIGRGNLLPFLTLSDHSWRVVFVVVVVIIVNSKDVVGPLKLLNRRLGCFSGLAAAYADVWHVGDGTDARSGHNNLVIHVVDV